MGEDRSTVEEWMCMFGKGTLSLRSGESRTCQNLEPFAKIKQCPLATWKQSKAT